MRKNFYLRALHLFLPTLKCKVALKKLWQRIGNWELWPFYLVYTPLGFVWLYYVVKARTFWFFSPVNPTLEFSGFEGEGKREMYEQLPIHLFPSTIYIHYQANFADVLEQVKDAGFAFPFIVKPDVGKQGVLFRKIESEQDLKRYHEHIPADYLVQELVDLPMEFSVFHIRYPGKEKGMVTGFILKEYLKVRGDGQSTLLQLIQTHPRACYREEEMCHKHEKNLQSIIPEGEEYYLSIAGNHNRGTKFINLDYEIDEQLCRVFDDISLAVGSFYYGRYDLKCTSIEDLKQGKHISILEYNGVGAEPNHIYDCNMSYFKALQVIAWHWRHMYEIGKINNQNGVPYWSYLKGRKYLKKAAHFFKMLNECDLTY